MPRTAIALIGGILLGALAAVAIVRLIIDDPNVPDPFVRDIADVPRMEQAVAEQHRLDSYAEIGSIDEIVALPTWFARAAATHVVASRLESAEIQRLMFDANRIADEQERVHLLEILVSRLAELDAQSALVLARTDEFGSHRALELAVWNTWGHTNLDDALFAARAQPSAALQNRAAQSLYAAFGFLGNETTDRIEAELGIAPDQAARAQYLYRLADRSPDVAIEFINVLGNDVHRQEYVRWLAYYLARRDPHAALAHASQFRRKQDAKRYESYINGRMARDDPQATIERLLASGKTAARSSEFHAALSALASTDIEAVKHYYGMARSAQERMTIASLIATELAKSDPEGALEWARNNDTMHSPNLVMSVITQIASRDPQRALDEALKWPDQRFRSSMISSVVSQIARDDPAAAAEAVDQLSNRADRMMASQRLVSTWIREDPTAAIDWIKEQDDETQRGTLQMAATQLAYSDLDAAIQLLPQLDEMAQTSLRQQIAQQLATSRTTAAAEEFIRQYEGQPGYDQLQASVISAVAHTDIRMAKQMADQLAPGMGRDQAYAQLISQQAMTDPTQAASWLNNIENEPLRGAAIGSIATQWEGKDPAAAMQWVQNLPAGRPRDTAIMHMSGNWGSATPEQLDLINSMEDANMRGQAKIRRVYQLLQTDRRAARLLLDDEDIPSHLREQVEMALSQYGM
ncbi:MAG: hypothetical protein QNJ14_08490 [Woeseiaceae bacterium]|nr:hypothetical protein [Woeseiaceae bacterium]